MQAGDLVKYKSHTTNAATGIVLRTAAQTGNGDVEVCFQYHEHRHTQFCRVSRLEVVSASR
jgi:hypothetical protein